MKVKDVVLKTLLDALTDDQYPDGYVSGERLAELCNVTRVSVWKAVNYLRSKGIAIDAVTNKGYKFIYSDIFTKDSILSLLPEKHDFKIRFYDTIDSTNTEAKRLLLKEEKNYLHKTVIVANQQTAGRGRFDRAFFSPSSTGIYFSIIYIPNGYIHPGNITAAAAVGLYRSILSVYGVKCGIKWTNDIVLDGKKIAGVLTEGITNFETGSIDSLIIGCGVNIIPNTNFPSDLSDIAGSICSNNADARRSLLCSSAIKEICNILDGDDLYKKNAMQEYKDCSVLMGKKVSVHPVYAVTKNHLPANNSYECTVIDILDNGVLAVKKENGEIVHLESGEVSLCL
ncbi:MAG: biotin--[acetyl-CoA-carboxylase] ligase [Treponema sp.]|nr:biotin--[acetyl-CoA-carboxylase] ligase [Treponema sp.]